ncbi:MAG: hypothetical protein U0441_00335 [Polyangiaceae bacterium]
MSDKTETKTSLFNPFAKAFETQLTQMNALFDEMAKMQATGLEQTKTALDETARLTKDTIGYWANLGAESRRMTVDAAKRTLGFFTNTGA